MSQRKIPIVGISFKPEQFATYMRALKMGTWRPSFMVLHNTAEPTLANWHETTGPKRIAGLASYYASLGWHAGPHLFVADDFIWVFSDLRSPGVHSPSWNSVSWGVEMVGDYDTESFSVGAGSRVRDNAIAALACLHMKTSIDTSTLRLHKEDPLTTHKGCPGRNVDKTAMIGWIHADIVRRRAAAAA